MMLRTAFGWLFPRNKTALFLAAVSVHLCVGIGQAGPSSGMPCDPGNPIIHGGSENSGKPGSRGGPGSAGNPDSTGGQGSVFRSGLSRMAGTPQTPFWLHANRDGLIPLNTRNNLLAFGAFHTSLLRSSGFAERTRAGLDAGFRLDARLSDGDNRLGFSQLYLHFRALGWQLSAGRFHDPVGLGSEGPLTTGSMLVSRNALQPFRLRLSTPGFLPVPLTGGSVSFRASWSESVTTDDRFVDRSRIHQKYLYLKVRPVGEVHLTAGIVHNLMWGGTHPELGRMHDTVGDWLSDVFIRGDDNVFGNVTPLGNSLGAYDFGAEYRSRTWSAGLFRQFYIEDGQSLDLPNPWDGMWRVYVDLQDPARPNRPVRYIAYEHINTKKQDADPWDAIGRGRYYSHNVWRDGWLHHGQVLGTPLILIDPDRIGSRDRTLVNNIVLAHHVGLAGHIGGPVSYELMATFSRNYGICDDQTAGLSCNGSPEEPVRERDRYVSYRELRRDRYSFMLRLALPVQALFGTLPPAISGASPDVEWAQGLELHISTAVDAGAFHERPLFGFEAGMRLSLPGRRQE
ncbi:MAG: capsule assembly Wzi family protein [Cyclonatronaceae bacterium]